MKNILLIFVVSFGLNLIWENLHSLLYDNYMSGPITEFILLRATLADAVMITVICLPFLWSEFFRKYVWLIVFLGIVVAITIEYYAMATDRWAYNSLMPLVPFLGTGLTPTIQLGFLGYLTFKIQDKVFKSKIINN